MEFERITVTKRGLEVQQQLKQILGFKECRQARTIRKKDYSENVLSKQQEQDICNPEFLEPKTETPEHIKLFLTNRFKNTRQKYIQKDIGNNSQQKKKFGCSFQNETNRSFKYLDFRQMQYLKTKYNDGFLQTKQNEKWNMMSKPQGQEMINEEDKYLAYQQARMERTIRKYEQFNEQTQNIPKFEKGIQRGQNFMSELLKSMEKKGSSTRVESLQEIKQKFGDNLDFLENHNFRKERFQKTMSQLHLNKYEKQWKRLRVGK